LPDSRQIVLDLAVNLGLMIGIVGQRGIDRAETQVRMLPRRLLRAPAMREFVQYDLAHFDLRVTQPRDAGGVDENERVIDGTGQGA
jgi:hypothetical protein